ncbi:MAG: DNA-packaging protein [Acidobacteria bacterium]|nr:DNA-packaging protein [Acidobacteriota bacterium]
MATLPPSALRKIKYDWQLMARPNQMKPHPYDSGNQPQTRDRSVAWFVWLILAGRGFGKTRAGAEFIRGEVEHAQRVLRKPIRCALIAPTAGDARDIMVEGDSGILGISPPDNMPKYESSKRKLTWKDGSIATMYSAEEAERLRGPQHHVGWADELAAWNDAEGTWNMLMFGMRLIRTPTLGPQLCVTTTPKPRPPLPAILRAGSTVVTSGSTYENRANLAPTFFDTVIKQYEGTRLGRQEIEGELLLDIMGALWNAKLIDKHRVRPEDLPDLVRLVVAIDPSVSEGEGADTGIIVAGIDSRGHVYVIADGSMQGTPAEWARKAIALFNRHKADKIVAEVNNGGAMVKEVLRSAMADTSLFSYKELHASRGKMTRAEPVSALYERGMVHHVGMFKELEDQMVAYAPAMAGKMLVDRMDALVWAVTELAVRDVQSASRRGMFSQ